jgi:hypothetical protein
MKKRFSEEQIIGFLREAEAGLPVKELCRRHGFSEESYYLWRSQLASFEAFGTDFGRLDDHFVSACCSGGLVKALRVQESSLPADAYWLP